VEGPDDSEGFTFVDSTDLQDCIDIDPIQLDDDIPPFPDAETLPYPLFLTLSLNKKLFRNPIQSRNFAHRLQIHPGNLLCACASRSNRNNLVPACSP